MGIMAGVVLLVAGNAFAQPYTNTIRWQTTGSYQIWDNGGVGTGTPLNPAGPYADGTSFLVQLLYAGANATNDSVNVATADPYGADNDDVFAAYQWIGYGVAPVAAPGRFNADNYENTRPDGSVYFIRAWMYPADAPANGQIAVSSGDFYGDSELFSVSGNTPPPAFDDFYLTADYATTLQVVPEPGTLALFGLGLVIAALRRRLGFTK